MTKKKKTAAGQAGKFVLQKIYLKDLSFETPNSPDIFADEWKPEVKMDLINEAKSIGESLYEVTLKISLDVNIKASNAYLIRTRQAGIFHIEGFDKDAVSRIAATTCPNILFPFARQHIADLILRGGFPQLLLAPVNFEAMYQQQLQAQQAPDPGVRH